MKYSITLEKTVGIYGTDDTGKPWTTFQCINHTVTCGECGDEIERGYVRGKIGEDKLHVCTKHVQLRSSVL